MKTFAEALKILPAPGGNGYHPAILGAANLARLERIAQAEAAQAIRAATPTGTRAVSDREILDAVSKAYGAPQQQQSTKESVLRERDAGAKDFAAMVAEADGAAESELYDASPVKPSADPAKHAKTLLREVYMPQDILFCGGRMDTAVKPVSDWHELAHRGHVAEYVIPNPLTGRQHTAGDGRQSYRCDAAVANFRFAVAEFDNKTRQEQCAFWYSAICVHKWHVVALIDSGGKSIHGWIQVGDTFGDSDIRDGRTWANVVENGLFRKVLVPLGCDPACRNEARLSRMPGHYREEKKRWQRLLYLAPDGRPR